MYFVYSYVPVAYPASVKMASMKEKDFMLTLYICGSERQVRETSFVKCIGCFFS